MLDMRSDSYAGFLGWGRGYQKIFTGRRLRMGLNFPEDLILDPRVGGMRLHFMRA